MVHLVLKELVGDHQLDYCLSTAGCQFEGNPTYEAQLLHPVMEEWGGVGGGGMGLFGP